MKNLFLLLLLLFSVTLKAASYDPANVDLTLGPEFEFSAKHAVAKRILGMDVKEIFSIIKNGDIDPSDIEYKQLKLFSARVAQKCQECKLEVVEGKFSHLGYYTHRFIFPDGWFFSLEPDVLVVEVTASPMLQSKEEIYKERLQKYVFDSAAEVGLTLDGHSNFMNRPGGHFNFGLWSAFGDSGKNFLKYFVDRANFPELSMGGFYKDYFNAPPLSVLKKEQRDKLNDVVSETVSNEKLNPAQVAKLIMDTVYTHSYFFNNKPYHFQSTGLKSAVKAAGFDEEDRPMEHRDHKMQENAEEFFLLAKLIKKRIEFLNMNNSQINYLSLDKKKYSAREIVSAFNIYVSEMGQDPEEFKSLLLTKVRSAEAFDISIKGKKVNWQDAHEVVYIKNNFKKLLTSVFLRERLKQEIMRVTAGERHIAVETLKELNQFIVSSDLKGKDQKVLLDFIREIDASWNQFVPKMRLIDTKIFRMVSCSRFYN
jgi:hypothetical protein